MSMHFARATDADAHQAILMETCVESVGGRGEVGLRDKRERGRRRDWSGCDAASWTGRWRSWRSARRGNAGRGRVAAPCAGWRGTGSCTSWRTTCTGAAPTETGDSSPNGRPLCNSPITMPFIISSQHLLSFYLCLFCICSILCGGDLMTDRNPYRVNVAKFSAVDVIVFQLDLIASAGAKWRENRKRKKNRAARRAWIGGGNKSERMGALWRRIQILPIDLNGDDNSGYWRVARRLHLHNSFSMEWGHRHKSERKGGGTRRRLYGDVKDVVDIHIINKGGVCVCVRVCGAIDTSFSELSSLFLSKLASTPLGVCLLIQWGMRLMLQFLLIIDRYRRSVHCLTLIRRCNRWTVSRSPRFTPHLPLHPPVKLGLSLWIPLLPRFISSRIRS